MLQGYQFIVSSVLLAGISADVHHLLLHCLLHVGIPDDGVA